MQDSVEISSGMRCSRCLTVVCLQTMRKRLLCGDTLLSELLSPALQSQICLATDSRNSCRNIDEVDQQAFCFGTRTGFKRAEPLSVRIPPSYNLRLWIVRI